MSPTGSKSSRKTEPQKCDLCGNVTPDYRVLLWTALICEDCVQRPGPPIRDFRPHLSMIDEGLAEMEAGYQRGLPTVIVIGAVALVEVHAELVWLGFRSMDDVAQMSPHAKSIEHAANSWHDEVLLPMAAAAGGSPNAFPPNDQVVRAAHGITSSCGAAVLQWESTSKWRRRRAGFR